MDFNEEVRSYHTTSIARFSENELNFGTDPSPPPIPPKNSRNEESHLPHLPLEAAEAPPMMSQDDPSPIVLKKQSRQSTFLPARVAESLASIADHVTLSRRSSYDIDFGGDSQSEISSNTMEPKLEEVKGWLWKLPVSKTFVPLDKVS